MVVAALLVLPGILLWACGGSLLLALPVWLGLKVVRDRLWYAALLIESAFCYPSRDAQ